MKLSNLPPGHMHQLTVGEDDVLLANVDGTIHAVENKCSHFGFALTKGALNGHRVVCPLHHACFDVRTGEQLEAPGMDGIDRFEVTVEDGEIKVGKRVPRPEEEKLAPARRRQTSPEHFDYAIVGGGVAAAYAVEAIRELDRKGTILLLSKEKLPPYDRTHVSKALMDGGKEVSELPLRSTKFYEDHGVTLQTLTRVERVDVHEKEITTNDGVFSYDKVLLATGGKPRRLDVPGADLEGVFTVRKAKDGKQARERVGEGTKVVIIGGSFIGLESAMSLGKQGGDITVVAREEVLFKGPFGERVGKYVQQLHEAAGVTFKLGAEPAELLGDGKVSGVKLKNGEELPAELVIVGIGVQPATDYLVGLAGQNDGSILVNNHLAADVDGVYVAGDIATYPGRDGEVRIEHWKVAGQQGRIAGRNMAGKSEPYTMLPYFWSNQQGINFRYAGHATDYDRVIFDGSPGESPFLAFYVKDDAVEAVLGVKRDGETAAISELLEYQRMPPVDELTGRDWHQLLRDARIMV